MSNIKPSSYSELASVIEKLPILVKENRRRLGLSIRGAATEIDCAFSTISRIENYKNINLANTVSILRWLGR